MTDSTSNVQFHLIQALRGFAALWVVLFHMGKGQYITGFTSVLPPWLGWAIFGYGSAGVAIFFVLSGFVMSHSLADKKFRGADVLRFAGRRSVRLDPPYWTAILFSVCVTVVLSQIHHEPVRLPSAATVIAHLFYMQEMTGRPEINVVFWTLTFEIQFYLILALATWFRSWAVGKGLTTERAWQIAYLAMFALAIMAATHVISSAPRGLFIIRWHAFFLGIAAYYAGHKDRSPLPLFAVAAVTLLSARGQSEVFGAPAAATALFLFATGKTGYVERGGSRRVLQAFGAISYSLYLVHVPIMQIGFGIWGRTIGRGQFQDSAGFLVVLVMVLLSSTALWLLIERPSRLLAAQLFRRGERA